MGLDSLAGFTIFHFHDGDVNDVKFCSLLAFPQFSLFHSIFCWCVYIWLTIDFSLKENWKNIEKITENERKLAWLDLTDGWIVSFASER